MIKSLDENRSSLTCCEFENRVNEMLDSRLDPCVDTQIVAHVRFCGECKSLLSTYSIFRDAEFCQAVDPINVIDRQNEAAKKRWAISSVVAAALLVGCLLLAEVTQNDFGEAKSVAIAEIVSSESERSISEDWENRPAEPISVVGHSNATQKFPASMEVGRAFANTNLGAVSWSEWGRNLESLQPVLDYSRRLPVVSSVQSTVDLTLGLIRAKTQEVVPRRESATPEYGILLNQFDDLA